MTAVAKFDLFDSLPPEWPDPLLPAIQAQASGRKVVLDDDLLREIAEHPAKVKDSTEIIQSELNS